MPVTLQIAEWSLNTTLVYSAANCVPCFPNISPEWVAFIRFLDSLDHTLIYPKADSHREQGQGNVGRYTHNAEYRQWKQQE